ncbi:replication initiation protein [Caldimonas tepidiphila]|uniref:replication initiation protein n=1 Tax=Caldimonas tepidiphila TaxID=2315841 RepID=UPI000E5BAB17|nr:replication initiation protein [Caldimonas tepidiphila]
MPPTSKKPVRSLATVPSAKDSQEMRKAVEAIAVTPRSGRITLLARRVFNILLYHAQLQGAHRETYRLPLSQLLTDSRFESNNTEILKEHLRQMVATNVEWHSPGRSWEVASLLASAKLEKGEDGHSVWIEWAYAPTIRDKLVKPEVYTRMTLEMITLLRTYAGAALYEIALRYRTSPQGYTMREDWQWWVPVLTGNPDIDTDRLEYKYFKRDIINPAISEVNTLQDELKVTLLEHKEGRRVKQLQFHIAANSQPSLALGAGGPVDDLIDMQLLGRMMKLGLPQEDAQQLYVKHDENLLRSALDHVEQRMADGSLQPLNNPVAYFRDALRKGYARKPAAAKKPALAAAPPVSAKDHMQRIRDAYADHQLAMARDLFNEQDAAARERDVRRFEEGPFRELAPAIAKHWRAKRLDSKPAATVFFRWLASETWPEPPTDAELLTFALEKGLLKAG